MCDRIQEQEGEDGYDRDQIEASRFKFAQAKSLMAQTGCVEINQSVSDCLDKNNREWRFC